MTSYRSAAVLPVSPHVSVTDMKSVVLIVSYFLLFQVNGFRYVNFAGSTDVPVDVDLTGVLHRVDRRFLSVTLGASLASKEKFMYLLSSPKLRTLAKALTPSFVRFGGTIQDFMLFTPQQHHQQHPGRELTYHKPLPSASCDELQLPSFQEEKLKMQWAQQVLVLREELWADYPPVNYTEATVDQLYAFAHCSGMDLIFGLNALLRTADNTWDSSNARSLLRYCESRRYTMSWELGNEPNSFKKKAGVLLDGHQLGQDFIHLREILSESKFYHDAGLYGPDISQPRDRKTYILDGFLQSGSDAVDACTWHHYYVDAKETSLEDFLNPDVLDSLALKIGEVLEIVKQASPGKPVWLGETSSAYGGGALGLSDTFVAGFMWLDKLGLAAKLGVDVVMRQVLMGAGSYHLVDDNLDPLPDYWLSLLYKELVGPEVLRVGVVSDFNQSQQVRVYLHCANRKSYRNGVTLITMNLRKNPARISLPPLMSSSTVDAFVLQSGEEALDSRFVKLNGDVLKMVDDQTLPDLKGHHLPEADHLQLPGFSLGFFVFTDTQPPACK